MGNIIWKDVEQQASQGMTGLVYRSEKHFDSQVEEVARAIFNDQKIRVVFVAGPSSSGKTTFSVLLKHELQSLGIMSHYLGLDNYFINRADVPYLPNGLQDFDSLHALDLPLINESIAGILNNEWIEVPHYNFYTGIRESGHFVLKLMEHDVVIIEGLHALNPIFCQPFDKSRIMRVAIMPMRNIEMPSGRILSKDDLRLLRRSIRDLNTRGYSFEETAKQWSEVRAAENKYIYPYTDTADFKVDSIHEYELFIYKQMMGQYLKDCYVDVFQNARACIAEVSNKQIPDIPESSLLNEFTTFKKVR